MEGSGREQRGRVRDLRRLQLPLLRYRHPTLPGLLQALPMQRGHAALPHLPPRIFPAHAERTAAGMRGGIGFYVQLALKTVFLNKFIH